MDDLISRQAAIDALRDAENHAFNSFYKGLAKAHKIIADLPSAQPEIKTDGDMISRQQTIDALMQEFRRIPTNSIRAKLVVENLPSAQPERKTGWWIYGEDDVAMCDGYHCSECGFFVPWDYKHKFINFIKDYNFCPSCGSPMLKEGEG